MSVTMMPVTEAKQRFTEIVRRAEEFFDRYLVTKNGKEAAILMSAEEYEGLLETLDVLASREEVQALSEATRQAKKHQTVSLEEYKSQKKSAGTRRARR